MRTFTFRIQKFNNEYIFFTRFCLEGATYSSVTFYKHLICILTFYILMLKRYNCYFFVQYFTVSLKVWFMCS